MNKIERQILLNQKVLIECKLGYSADDELIKELKSTNRLLKDKNLNSCCTMDAIDRSKGKNEQEFNKNIRVHGLKRKVLLDNLGVKKNE